MITSVGAGVTSQMLKSFLGLKLKKSGKYVKDAVEEVTTAQAPVATEQTTKSKSYLIPIPDTTN